MSTEPSGNKVLELCQLCVPTADALEEFLTGLIERATQVPPLDWDAYGSHLIQTIRRAPDRAVVGLLMYAKIGYDAAVFALDSPAAGKG